MLFASSIPATDRDGDREGMRTRWVVGVIAAIVALCAAMFALIGEGTSFAFTWLPGIGPMSLSLGSSSLLAAAATAAALSATALIVEPPSPLAGGVALLALASGNVSFLAGHFLLRYVALEMVGLLIAGAPLLPQHPRDHAATGRGTQAAWVYLLLRLGDAGLLTAILMLWTFTGTLAIGPALEAGMAMGRGAQAWAAGGFLLAVAVKTGLWPFQAWVRSAERLDRLVETWLYATLMPNLGLYLLYRVGPWIGASPRLRWIAVGVGGLMGVVTFLTGSSRERRGRQPARTMAGIGAVLGCAAMGLDYRIAWWGLLVLSMARLPLFINREVTPVSATWAALDHRMRRLARRLHANVQERALERGLSTLMASLNAFAGWLHDRVEQDILERGLTEGADKALTGAQRLYENVEEGGLEGGLRGLVHTILHASHHLRLWHGGKLRINLGWVVLSLVVALFVALIA